MERERFMAKSEGNLVGFLGSGCERQDRGTSKFIRQAVASVLEFHDLYGNGDTFSDSGCRQ